MALNKPKSVNVLGKRLAVDEPSFGELESSCKKVETMLFTSEFVVPHPLPTIIYRSPGEDD